MASFALFSGTTLTRSFEKARAMCALPGSFVPRRGGGRHRANVAPKNRLGRLSLHHSDPLSMLDRRPRSSGCAIWATRPPLRMTRYKDASWTF